MKLKLDALKAFLFDIIQVAMYLLVHVEFKSYNFFGFSQTKFMTWRKMTI